MSFWKLEGFRALMEVDSGFGVVLYLMFVHVLHKGLVLTFDSQFATFQNFCSTFSPLYFFAWCF